MSEPIDPADYDENCPLCGETKKTGQVWACGTWKRNKGYYQGESCELSCAEVKIEELEAESKRSMYEAKSLAESMVNNHHPDNKDFELLPNVSGIITQISNMVAGLSSDKAALQKENKRLGMELDVFNNSVEEMREDVENE